MQTNAVYRIGAGGVTAAHLAVGQLGGSSWAFVLAHAFHSHSMRNLVAMLQAQPSWISRGSLARRGSGRGKAAAATSGFRLVLQRRVASDGVASYGGVSLSHSSLRHAGTCALRRYYYYYYCSKYISNV